MEWTDRATQALSIADRAHATRPSRSLLVDAFEVLDPSGWLHFRVGLEEQDVEDLTLPSQFFTQQPLEHVRRAADRIATAMGSDHVELGHVALAWAITARTCPDRILDSVIESMGLPTMADATVAQLRNHVLEELLEPAEPQGSTGDSPIGFGSLAAWQAERACNITSIATRILAALVLSAYAVTGGGWWLFLFAPTVLVSTHQSNRGSDLLASRSRPWTLPIRFPWLLLVAAVLTLLSRPRQAMLVAVTWLVVRGLAHLGEWVTVHGTVSSADGASGAWATFIRPAGAFVVRNGFYDTVITVAAGIFTWTATAMLPGLATVGTGLCLGLLTAAAVEDGRGSWAWTSSWFRALALGATAVLVLRIGWPALVWPFVASGGLVLVRRNHRIDYPALAGQDLPREERLTWRDEAQGRWGRVIANLSSRDNLTPDLTAALALSYVRMGYPGEGKRLARLLPDSHEALRELINAEAAFYLHELPESPSRDRTADPHHLRRATVLAEARALQDSTPEVVADLVRQQLPQRITRSSVVWAAQCYNAIGEALMTARPTTASVAISRAFGLMDYFVTERRENLRRAGMEAQILQQPLEHVVGMTSVAMANMILSEEDDNPLLSMFDGDALLSLTEFTSPFLVATYCNRGATLTKARFGLTSAGVDLRIQALASLNSVRHTLASRDDRMVWWSTFTPTLEALLDEACERQDWPLLLEVIEASRLQLGTSDESLRPTALHIGERSRLGSARYLFGQRPSPLNLAEAIRSSGGPGTWWWSTHFTEEHYYWACADTTGAVHGGRRERPELDRLLGELEPHLSYRFENETEDAFQARMTSSALFGRPSPEETDLASRLGSLIPSVIAEGAYHRRRPALYMALAPELGRVPWASALVGHERLIELYDIVIAPPASLLPQPDLSDRNRNPVAVALINPGDDLPGAERLHALAPRDTNVISYKTPDRRASFGTALRAAPYDTTLVLACHTVVIDRRRGFVLGPLAGTRTSEILFAADIATTPTDYPMPRQVVALACATSEITSARLGEWSVLGAALIQAGARRALVTAFPILDIPEIDRIVLDGIQDGSPLHVLIASIQLDRLRRWKAGDPTASPLTWAGLQLFGALPSQPQWLPTPRTCWVAENLLAGLDEAATATPGSTVVTVADLMTYFTDYGHLDGLSWRQRAAARRAFVTRWPYPLHYLGYWARWRKRGKDAHPRVLGADLIEVILDARRLATEAGQRVYDIDHVFLAALRSNHPAAVTMRNITGFDARNPQIVQRFLEDDQNSWYYTGERDTPHLAPGESLRVYHLLEVEAPQGADQWHHPERIH